MVGEEKPAGDPVERQGLIEKAVIHPGRRIDLDLDVVVLAMKMKDAVDDEVRWMPEFVVDDFLEIFRIDPDDRFGQSKRALNVFKADFVVREIVGDRAGARPFIANDAEIVEIERAVFETQDRAGFVHPGAAETRPLRRDRTITDPGFRVATRAADGETNRGRAAPFPLREKTAELGGSEGAENDRVDRALEVEPKIVWRAAQLARFMAEPQLADHGALAVPRKIRGQFQERNGFVTEALDIDAADDTDLRRVRREIGGPGKLEERR